MDEPIPRPTQCLFCEAVEESPEVALEHLQARHSLALLDPLLTFYDRIRLVNFLRHARAVSLKCPSADCTFIGVDESGWIEHLSNEHPDLGLKLPACKSQWNKPEYYIPLFDEDPLLEVLDSDSELDGK